MKRNDTTVPVSVKSTIARSITPSKQQLFSLVNCCVASFTGGVGHLSRGQLSSEMGKLARFQLGQIAQLDHWFSRENTNCFFFTLVISTLRAGGFPITSKQGLSAERRPITREKS